MPFILIADEAISIGMFNDLYMKYYEEFYKYLNEHCYVTMKQSPSLGFYDEWECDSCFWMIRPLSGDKSGFFLLKERSNPFRKGLLLSNLLIWSLKTLWKYSWCLQSYFLLSYLYLPLALLLYNVFLCRPFSKPLFFLNSKTHQVKASHPQSFSQGHQLL